MILQSSIEFFLYWVLQRGLDSVFVVHFWFLCCCERWMLMIGCVVVGLSGIDHVHMGPAHGAGLSSGADHQQLRHRSVGRLQFRLPQGGPSESLRN